MRCPLSQPPPFRPRARAPRLISRLALAGLAATLAGCGEAGAGASAPSDPVLAETFWDAAKTAPKTRGTTRYGKLVGEYSEFHKNAQVSKRGNYNDEGVEEGVWEEFHPSGRTKSRTTWVNGLKQGAIEEWHDSGKQAQKGQYLDGVEDGVWTTYHPTGELLERITFAGGKVQGALEVFWPSGKLRDPGPRRSEAPVTVKTSQGVPSGSLTQILSWRA